jgi:hypothetical protein
MMAGRGYHLRFTAGYSGLDHLGPEIVSLATNGDPARVFATYADARQALVRAVASMRRTLGPQSWPNISIVPVGLYR